MATLNINVGVLGHVDSGKTSLAKSLSSVASTASFDKDPQSRSRGITLDLGFSSFSVDQVPEHLQEKAKNYSKVQFTLVDCPGHASLIKTIIGGAQIIDLMMLVVDITKGVQTQTAECIIIGEVTCDRLLLVLNKVDLVPLEKREQTVDRMKKRLWKTLEKTKFKNCPIVVVAANPGGSEHIPATPDNGTTVERCSEGIPDLISALLVLSPGPGERRRSGEGPFLFSVDHCFGIRGQGTVLTGTVLNGSVKLGDTIEIPSLKMERKVKSMQMFKKPVERASQGDRVGICVTQFDPDQLERGLACSPKTVPTIYGAVIRATPVQYFRDAVRSNAKIHVTVGHETALAKITVFEEGVVNAEKDAFDLQGDYLFREQLVDKDPTNQEESRPRYLLLELDRPVICPRDSLVIGSRLDWDPQDSVCRLAFHGRLLWSLETAKYRETLLPSLKIFKRKSRSGQVERCVDTRTVIVRGLFKKEGGLASFVGLRVHLSTGHSGRLEGGFGQSGKCRVALDDDLPEDIVARFTGGGRKKGKSRNATSDGDVGQGDPVTVTIEFKRYIFDPEKKMIQK